MFLAACSITGWLVSVTARSLFFLRTSRVFGLLLQTLWLRKPRRKKSDGVRSGDRRGQRRSYYDVRKSIFQILTLLSEVNGIVAGRKMTDVTTMVIGV